MPTRPHPSPEAQRQREDRRRRRERLLYAVADVPLRLAERLGEAGLLRQQDAKDMRALGAALVQASERFAQKE